MAEFTATLLGSPRTINSYRHKQQSESFEITDKSTHNSSDTSYRTDKDLEHCLPACTESNSNDKFVDEGSTLLCADFSLDQPSVFSPLRIPIACSNETSNSPAQTNAKHIAYIPINRSNSPLCTSDITYSVLEITPLLNSPCPQSQSEEDVPPNSLDNDCVVTLSVTDSLNIANDDPISFGLNTALTSGCDNIELLTEYKHRTNGIITIHSSYPETGDSLSGPHTSNHDSTKQLNTSREPGSQASKNFVHIPEGESKISETRQAEVPKQAKRRRRRAKSDPDEPPLPPQVTILPPCEICGSKSSGFHYGANTCEACKGFFRRTLKKIEVKFQCVCTVEEKEERRQGNGVGKNTCPACRYQQCLAVGMSRNAIKIGRYSLQKKTENICHVKTLKGDDDVIKLDQKSPGSSIFSLNSPPSSVSSVTQNVNSPGDQNDSGYSECGSPAKKSKTSGELTLCEIDTHVKTLYHAHKSLLQEESFIQIEELRRHQKDYFEQYQLKKQLFGPMKPISKQEYFEFYNSTGIEIDNRKQMVQEAVDYFEGKISKLVEFAKCIPGFRDLPLQDQANLIKCSRVDCGLVALRHQQFNEDNLVTTTPWGRNMHLDEIGQIVSKDFMFAKFHIKKMAHGLDLSQEEEALLTAVLLTFTDRCELTDADRVQNIQYKLVACLEYLIKIRPTNKPNKLGRIFSFLTALRNVSEWEAEIIKEISLDWPTVAIPEKLELCVRGGLEDSSSSVSSQS